MRMKSLRIVMISSLLLTACVHAPQSSMQREIAQTRQLVPDVNCGEHAPHEPNPAYPIFSGSEDSLADVTAYAARWQDWAVDSDAVNRRNGVRFRAVGDCLDKLRGQGLIN